MCPTSEPAGEPPPALHLHQPARAQDASALRYEVVHRARERGLQEALVFDLELAV
ncbi:hypothetical protein [Amycolatopsis sp. NPDC051372]|uniref:hypothetical protein n=1 Tax=unclassified Amycolatopsis TaxID=2618356 RepID=UPI003446858D